MTLSGSQFALPGMESMRPAAPHEQTANQFHNRPDVFVHGRYERTMTGSKELDLHSENTRANSGFHAGTERAAHDRLQSLGSPHADHSPRFYHGRVDPEQMQNTGAPGHWEEHGWADGAIKDQGRMADQGEEWRKREHGSYYRNDYEDKGSTSVILPLSVDHSHPSGASTYTPQNFNTHREAVSEAIGQGKRVPAHVMAVYDATGGAAGPRSVVHPHFEQPQTVMHPALAGPNARPAYAKDDEPLTTQLKWAVRNFGSNKNPNGPFVPSGGEPPF